MAGYQYRGTDPIRAAQERKQRLQNELDKARQEHKEAQRLNRENQRIEQQIIQTQNRTAQLIETPTRRQPLPEPRYGGPQGLIAAVAEIKEHNERKKTHHGHPMGLAA